MTSLTSIQPLTDRLFAEAHASDATLRQDIGQLTPAERTALIQTSDYKALYGTRLKDAFLAISPETGRLLYLLARSTKATSIVEFGTSFGLSTIHLAAAVHDNGGGRVIGSELEPTKVARARAHIAEAGFASFTEVREGDALETLARDLPASVDLLLLDGAKNLYPRVFALLAPRLRPGSLILADNADHAPDYLAQIRGAGFVSVPFADDIELSMKL